MTASSLPTRLCLKDPFSPEPPLTTHQYSNSSYFYFPASFTCLEDFLPSDGLPMCLFSGCLPVSPLCKSVSFSVLCSWPSTVRGRSRDGCLQ